MVTDLVRIGEMLLARGLISREQLDRALEVQTSGDSETGLSPGETLGTVILRLGLVEPMALVRCLCAQKGTINFLVVDDYLVEPALAERIPRRLALELQLLPLVRLDEETVLAATTRLLPGDKVDFLHQLTGVHVEQILVEDADFRQKVFGCYRGLEARRSGARRTGDLLVDEGLITTEQRDWALAEADLQQRKVTRILIENGLISEEELFAAVAKLTDLPLIAGRTVEQEKDAGRIARALPRSFAVHNSVVPYRVSGDTMDVVTSDPNLDADQLALLLHVDRVRVHLATPSDMERILRTAYPSDEGAPRGSADHTAERAPTPGPGVRSEFTTALPVDPEARRRYETLIDDLLREAVSRGATHVHIESHQRTVLVRLRAGGKLREVSGLPVAKGNVGEVVAVLKDLGGLDLNETRVPQAGALKRRAVEGRNYDFRLQTQPTLFGEDVVIRVLAPPDDATKVLGLELSGPAGMKYLAAARGGSGVMVLVSPTTRQRSQIAYVTLDLLTESGQRKAVTVEDPIERSLETAVQSEVSHEVGYTFAEAVASFRRVDPDVVYVSEMDTEACAAGCFRLAEGGCLVLAGIQMPSTAEALDVLLAWSSGSPAWPKHLLGVLLRRSARALCSNCKRSYQPSRDVLAAVRRTADAPPSGPFFRALGCPQCDGTGRRGEVVFSEYLAVDDVVREALSASETGAQVLDRASEESYIPLRSDVVRKATAGLVDITEAATDLLGFSQE